MLNELLKDEEFGKIFFAELLNQNGCDTGVDTVNMFEEWFKERSGESLDGEELERLKQSVMKNRRCIPVPMMFNEEPTADEDMVILKDVLDKDDTMEDIPINIRQLEEKGKDLERLAEPNYYAGNGLSPLEAFKKGLLSREETIGFIKGNIIKYVTRAGHKHNASEDMVKAIDYCGHLKRLYEHEMIANNDNPIVQKSKRIFREALEGLDKLEDVEVKEWLGYHFT